METNLRHPPHSVMVFEKMPLIGGNTRISDGGGGLLSAPDNFMQERLGVAGSPRLFSKDILRACS